MYHFFFSFLFLHTQFFSHTSHLRHHQQMTELLDLRIAHICSSPRMESTPQHQTRSLPFKISQEKPDLDGRFERVVGSPTRRSSSMFFFFGAAITLICFFLILLTLVVKFIYWIWIDLSLLWVYWSGLILGKRDSICSFWVLRIRFWNLTLVFFNFFCNL